MILEWVRIPIYGAILRVNVRRNLKLKGVVSWSRLKNLCMGLGTSTYTKLCLFNRLVFSLASRVQTLQRDQALATVQQNQFIVLTRLWGEAEGLLAGLAAVVRTLAAQFLATRVIAGSGNQDHCASY